jgi:hypothetical protein
LIEADGEPAMRAFLLGAGLALGLAASTRADAGGNVVVPPITIAVNGWVQSFATGSGTATSCNTTQTCVTANGNGEATISSSSLDPGGAQGDFNGQGFPLGKYKFSASLTIDSGNTTPNGFGGTCSAAGGTVTLTLPHAFTGSLVLDVQGTQCAVGDSTTEEVLNATYVVESPVHIGSSGASGTGSFSMSLNSATTPTALDLSFSGHLNLWVCPVCDTETKH